VTEPAETLAALTRDGRDGCLTVSSPTMGEARIYLLFGTVFHAASAGTEGSVSKAG
jgi:hypothetical protein